MGLTIGLVAWAVAVLRDSNVLDKQLHNINVSPGSGNRHTFRSTSGGMGFQTPQLLCRGFLCLGTLGSTEINRVCRWGTSGFLEAVDSTWSRDRGED